MAVEAAGSGDRRTGEIAANLAVVRDRIAAAARTAGRDPARADPGRGDQDLPGRGRAPPARRSGVTELGEARDQEARVKARELPEARWHFVGRLQRNKAALGGRRTPPSCTPSTAPSWSTRSRPGCAEPGGPPLDVLVQVSLDGDPDRGGALPDDVGALADAAAATGLLRVAGVMAIAPLGADPDDAFARLAAVADRLRADHPAATAVSAGMSADLEAAVRHGATHLRIGTALLGGRPPLPG